MPAMNLSHIRFKRSDSPFLTQMIKGNVPNTILEKGTDLFIGT